MQNFHTEFYAVIEALRDFLELGGPVLVLITLLAAIMWTLMIERLLYVFIFHRKIMRQLEQKWRNRSDRSSWYAHQIRVQLISQASMKLEKNLPVIKSLVILCPLMGLLGTVSGMIEVFDVIAISGSGNARSLAAGVSRATVPTMAGMVVALSGVFISSWLHREANRLKQLHSENMTFSSTKGLGNA